MSSPVFFSFFDSIVLDRSLKESLYLQIVNALINGIENGKLAVGLKLPGTRVLAEKLEVHRKTIIAAYQELESQGWISMKENVGSFVLPSKSQKKNICVGEMKPLFADGITTVQVKQSNILDSPYESHSCSLAINDGQPDYRLNSMDEWTRMYRNSLKRRQILRKLGDFQFNGVDIFKQKLIDQLKEIRGINVSNSELVTGRSADLLLYILAQILIEKEEVVLVGEFSFFSTNMILQQVGAKVKTIPMDEHGMDVDYIEKHFCEGDIRLLVITVQNNYPNTVNLSQERRSRLLKLAEKLNFLIIEEDREHEFFFERKNRTALVVESNNGRVFYLGTFGRSLLPTFHTYFLIAPNNVILEVQKYLGLLEGQTDVIIEQTLAEWIQSGEINRQMKKMLKIYKERRNACLINLNEILGSEIEFSIPSGGLAVWIRFKKSFPLKKWADYCRQMDLFIPMNCLVQNKKLTALRLGFGNLSPEEMKQAINIMNIAYQKMEVSIFHCNI